MANEMETIMHKDDHVRIREEHLLADDWHVLKKTTFDYRRRDGRWQTLTRETYDRGNGATALLYNLSAARCC